MKTTYISLVFSALLLVVGLIGCNEDEFLKEEPLDFFSPSNSFVTFGRILKAQ